MKIKVDFVDFYKELDKEDNFFINALRKIVDVEVSNTPDLLLFGNYGYDHLKYNCYKIFYTSENVRPDFRFCDFSISFDSLEDKRNFRLPLYVIHINDLIQYVKLKKLNELQKNKFCNFVYSNGKAFERIEFFKLLSKYKYIDSPGKVMNNMRNDFSGKRFDYYSKLDFLSNYKFTIAFENESFPGYVTEKIIHPLLVGSIPIYWGSALISEEIDDSLFINVHNFNSFESAIERIKEIDSNNMIYDKFQNKIHYLEEIKCKYEINLISFFKNILNYMGNNQAVSSTIKGKRERLSQYLFVKFENFILKSKSVFE